jgi:hypothetical protein
MYDTLIMSLSRLRHLNFLLVATLHIVSTQITLSLQIPNQHGYMNFRFLDDTYVQEQAFAEFTNQIFLNQELVKVNLLELSKAVFRHFSRIKLKAKLFDPSANKKSSPPSQ